MGRIIPLNYKADERLATAVREVFERAVGELQALGLSQEAIAHELMANAVFEACEDTDDNGALVAKVQKSAGLLAAALFDNIGE